MLSSHHSEVITMDHLVIVLIADDGFYFGALMAPDQVDRPGGIIADAPAQCAPVLIGHSDHGPGRELPLHPEDAAGQQALPLIQDSVSSARVDVDPALDRRD